MGGNDEDAMDKVSHFGGWQWQWLSYSHSPVFMVVVVVLLRVVNFFRHFVADGADDEAGAGAGAEAGAGTRDGNLRRTTKV